MIETITHHDTIMAIIIRHEFSKPGVHFFTPDDFSQQIAYMRRPTGEQIQPHVHIPCERNVLMTQEVLFIKSGRLRVDFYSKDRHFLESRELGPGDTILLADGGHGFEILEEVEMIEVKQGPYVRDRDKERFDPAKGDC